MTIGADVLIFATVCGLIAIVLGVVTRQAHNQWMQTVVRLVEENSGIVEVRQLKQSEVYEESGRRRSAEFLDSQALYTRILQAQNPYYKPPPIPMSDIFEFTVDTGSSSLVFRMRPERNEFLTKSIRWGGAKVKLDWDDIKKLKEIGHNAYVMWKMGNYK